jgi:hypothetical protein
VSIVRAIRISLFGAALALIAASPIAVAQSICGRTTDARAGETLADIAERCDVAIGGLRQANPGIGAAPAEGTAIAMPTAAAEESGDLLGRAGDLLRDAGREIEEAARGAGQSVRDYLANDPDIGRDIREFGESYGLPGFSGAAGGGVSITLTPAAPRAGDEVTIVASGLAAATEAEIGIGRSRTDYEMRTKATTDAAGRLEQKLVLPDWVSASESIIIVVDTPNVTLRSDPVAIAAE